ncbi:hypothetical protein Y032_0455g1773 [Ancylostoma ceylanicum]|uniref:Helix-turn-helix domain-containing protein n=1 Tax=Ancylostoma ceylanicum TaxID=53326 RepID=A0A016WZG8_9BILA|nr:hypothetical protein Y032_0455g1773 [Ancylostoma ceylanicum]
MMIFCTSGCQSSHCIFELVKLLSPLLSYVGAYIVNSSEFVDAIKQCRVPDSACYVSYDVVSLYTNINNDAAIKTLLQLFDKHSKGVNMCGFSAEDFETLLKAALACNIFGFNNDFYAQKRGLAIGIRIAIVYFDHIEKASLTNGIILHKRYIDDVFVIGSSHAELRSTLTNLSSMDVNITLTVDEPSRDRFLPFLNTNARICSGKTDIRWYRKPSSKNIILHSRSAHHTHMEVNVVRNLVKTSERVATSTSENDEPIQHILFENGYNSGETTTWRPSSAPDGIALVPPYPNNHHAKRINAVVKRSRLPVRLIFLPHPPSKRCSHLHVCRKTDAARRDALLHRQEDLPFARDGVFDKVWRMRSSTYWRKRKTAEKVVR